MKHATNNVACALLCCATASVAFAQHDYAPVPPAVLGEDGRPLSPTWSGLSRTNAYNAAGAGTKVAIVASAAGDVTDAEFTDPQDKLIVTGLFSEVAVIHAGLETPALFDLMPYDAVLVWSNFDFLDPDALGDNLADYVDNGRGVVTAVFANTSDVPSRHVGGRWESDGYHVIAPQLGNDTGSAALGTVYDASHPLMVGVTSFAGGTLSARPTTTSLHAAATLVADWDDGKPLVVFRDDLAGRRVDLGFYPPSDDVVFLYWDAGTDGDRLLANALSYAAQQDLTDVAVRLFPLPAPSGVDTTDDPDALVPGQCQDLTSFVVEIWVSDVGALNTGVTAIYLDLVFDNTVLQAEALVHTALFPDGPFAEGEIDNPAGMVRNFGSFSFDPQGIEPTWARLGYVGFTALSADPTSVFSALGLGGIGVSSRPPPTVGEMSFGSADVPPACTPCTTGGDCDDEDICTLDLCQGSLCSSTPRVYGDLSGLTPCQPDGGVNAVDILAILNYIQNIAPCDEHNVDIAGLTPCAADGAVNALDILGILNTISGLDDCGCG